MGHKKRLRKIERSIAAVAAAIGTPLGSVDPGRPAVDRGRDQFGQPLPGVGPTPPAIAGRTSGDALAPKGAAGHVIYKARVPKVKGPKVHVDTFTAKAAREEDPMLRRGYMQLAKEAGEDKRSRSEWLADATELDRRAAVEDDRGLREGYKLLAAEARTQATR